MRKIDINDELNSIKQLLSEKKIDEATKRLSDLSHHFPDNRAVWTYLASIAIRSGDFQSAIRPLENWIRIDPTSPIASSGLAQSHARTGNNQAAIAEIERFKKFAIDGDTAAEHVLNEQAALANSLS